MSDALLNGLLLPVLTSPPPPAEPRTVRLFVQNGQVKLVDANGVVTVLTNV